MINSCNDSTLIKPVKTGFLRVDKAKIYYEIFGSGEPVVLIHAGVTDSRMWNFQINELSRHFKVVRYDMRGFGKSSLPDSIYYPNMDLLTLLDSCNIEKANLVGISLGAMQAIDFTINYPNRVKSLIISCPGFPDQPMSQETLNKSIEFNKIVKEKGADSPIYTLINDPFWSQTLPSREYPKAKALFEQILYENKKAFTVNWQLRKNTLGLKDRLSEIKCSTLMFKAENEMPSMISNTNTLKEKIEGIKIVEIEKVSHLLNMERPNEFNKAIIDFIENK